MKFGYFNRNSMGYAGIVYAILKLVAQVLTKEKHK